MRKLGPILGLWLLLFLGGMVVGRQHQTHFTVSADQHRERGDILLDLLGEFRTVMARYLWFKMDLFHEVLDDEGQEAEKQAEVLPLLRMVSLLDPSMTDSYDIIAWDLYKGHHQAEQALKILDEGLERNPDSFLLNFRRCLILYKEERFQAALQSSQRAVDLAQDEFDILNAVRMMYWSAKKAGDRDLAVRALDHLQVLRPDEPFWRTEKAALGALPRI